MTGNRETRSSISGMSPAPSQSSGVGGRHGSGPSVAGRGGYPDICTESGLPVRDPRLAELRQCGLGWHWLRVAQEIGVDAFLATWRVLSETAPADDHGRVNVPSFRTYLRHQRNLVIATMAGEGLTAPEIRQELKRRLGYDLTEGHIRKLIRESKE